ncbi:hypothetical protein PXQ59_002144 [Vibrio parahaemolyticus]|nr:hypothetical protein [Vibrio parahaemolyticus]EKZ9227188.1 hypothetical protein [Vibrio parahaemolyticus]
MKTTNNNKNLIKLPFSTAILNSKASTIDLLFHDLLPKHILTLMWVIGRYQLFENTILKRKPSAKCTINMKALRDFRNEYRREKELNELISALNTHPYIASFRRVWSIENNAFEFEVEMSELFFEEMNKSDKKYYVDLDFLKTKEVAKSRDMIFYAILIDFNGIIDRNAIIDLSNKIKAEKDIAVTSKQRANRIQKIKAAFMTLAELGYLENFAYHVVKKFKLTFKALTKCFNYKPFSKNRNKAERKESNVNGLDLNNINNSNQKRKKEDWEDVDFDQIFKEMGIS